jgi:uncharacterized protein (TIGR02145 family)
MNSAMIFKNYTIRLFPLFILLFQVSFISSVVLSQKAWEEPFEVTQLNRFSKGKFNGYFQLDNFTKNEKKSEEKAKHQIIYQLIYRGVQENTNLRLVQIKPVSFIPPSALELKEGESEISKFIELQGQEAIVSIVYAGKDQSPNKDHVSWFIDVDMKKLADLLEAAHLKQNINAFFGYKLKAIYCPKFITEDVFSKIVNESSSRSRYLEEFNLLKNEYGDQFEWINLIDFSKEIMLAMKENGPIKKESLNQLIVRTLKVDLQVEFKSTKVSSGMADQCSLVFIDAFDLSEVDFTKPLNLVGGLNQTTLVSGYLTNRSDVFNEVIQLSNAIYNRFYVRDSKGKEYTVRVSINPRLNKNFSDVILLNNKEYPLWSVVESTLKSFSNEPSFHAEKPAQTYSFNYGKLGSKLICHDVDFQTALSQKMKENTGYQLDFEFFGNSTFNIILTDLTVKERQIKMIEDFEQAKRLNTLNDYEAYLKKYPDSDKVSEVESLIQKTVKNERNTKFESARSENTLNSYRSFLLSYNGEDKYQDSLYLEASSYYLELFNQLVEAKALNTNDLLSVFKDGLINGDEIIVLDPLYESTLPPNWKDINSLTEINRVISELHAFCRKIGNGLDQSLFTKLTLTTGEFDEQEWTGYNLRVSHFLNGDVIPQAMTNEEWAQATSSRQPAWCYFENDSTNFYEKGKLYNYYALIDPRGIIPEGYRIPSTKDYEKLAVFCGGVNVAANSLKCPYSWGEENEDDEFGTNAYFGLIPLGFRDQRGFLAGDDIAAFWTSNKTSSVDKAAFVSFSKGKKEMSLGIESNMGTGLAVKMIKNEYRDDQSPEDYSMTMGQLELIRDKLILKEFGLLKKYEEVDPFLRKQLTKELELPIDYANDIDADNINSLFKRFFENDEVMKNGIYLSYFMNYEYGSCVQGDGYGGVMEDKIGFVNNVQNYVLYEDGSYYKGELKDASPSGTGLFVILEDNMFGEAGRYEGQFEDGYLSNGKITFKNKNVYVGQCEGNVPNGTGKMTLASGKILDGDFKDGEYIKPFACKQVKIGDKVWMAENLNVDHFRNGDEIPEARTIAEWRSGSPAWCYYNNDPANATKYGKLYNAAALNDPRGLAPEGWHVPSHIEFNQLVDDAQPKVNALKQRIENAKNQGIEYDDIERTLFKMLSNDDKSKQIASFTLRSSIGWGDANANGTNITGFNAYPSRYRSEGGTFETRDIDTKFWTSSTRSNNGVVTSYISYSLFTIPMFYMYSEYRYVYTDGPITDEYLNNVGMAVRCVKNQ